VAIYTLEQIRGGRIRGHVVLIWIVLAVGYASCLIKARGEIDGGEFSRRRQKYATRILLITSPESTLCICIGQARKKAIRQEYVCNVCGNVEKLSEVFELFEVHLSKNRLFEVLQTF
jgi:hypothetical protein